MAKLVEFAVGVAEGGPDRIRSDGEPGERPGLVGRAMLQDDVAGCVEQDVDDGTLGRCVGLRR